MNYELTAEVKISVCGVRDAAQLRTAITSLRTRAQERGLTLSEFPFKLITDLHVTAAQDENGVDLAVDSIQGYAGANP